MKNPVSGKIKHTLYLIEYYTKQGTIKFAWVDAAGKQAAILALKKNDKNFDETIQIGEQTHIEKLALGKEPQPKLIRSNPDSKKTVHKLSKGAPRTLKKRQREFTLQAFIEGKTYYWTGINFDTLFQKAIIFNSIPLAKLAAKAAYKKYPKINIYLSGDGVTA
jgi:hypothetical protein